MNKQHSANAHVLQINVGFLLNEGVGYARTITFDEGEAKVEELTLNWLLGDILFTRTAQGILAQGWFDSEVSDTCVRCLEPAKVPFTVELSHHFLYPPNPEPDEDQFNISEGGLLDLTPIVREDAILAVPMHVLCKPDCLGLCDQCGTNLNEGSCECDHEAIDPRMEALRALLDDEEQPSVSGA